MAPTHSPFLPIDRSGQGSVAIRLNSALECHNFSHLIVSGVKIFRVLADIFRRRSLRQNFLLITAARAIVKPVSKRVQLRLKPWYRQPKKDETLNPSGSRLLW